MKKYLIISAACLMLSSLVCDHLKAEQINKGKTLESLDPHLRELVSASLTRSDQKWDERAGMLWNANPGSSDNTKKTELSKYQKEIKSRIRTDLHQM